MTIDTVLSNLLDNPDRTFSYVEQAFFQRWRETASDTQLQQMQGVVASGQFKFLNGAWAMHDEASPSYVDMIDNTALVSGHTAHTTPLLHYPFAPHPFAPHFGSF